MSNNPFLKLSWVTKGLRDRMQGKIKMIMNILSCVCFRLLCVVTLIGLEC